MTSSAPVPSDTELTSSAPVPATPTSRARFLGDTDDLCTAALVDVTADASSTTRHRSTPDPDHLTIGLKPTHHQDEADLQFKAVTDAFGPQARSAPTRSPSPS